MKTERRWKPLTILTSYAASWMGIVPLITLGSPARAADAPSPAPRIAPAPAAFDFAFGARLQSDYNFRGISRSDRRPSPQGYGEVQLFDKLFYAGIAAYGVDLPTSPLAEIDLTAGIRPTFGLLSLDLNEGECFVDTTDPSGIVSGSGHSNWCSAAFIATLSVDFTADSLMALMPRN